MDIIKFALEKEELSEHYYRELERKAQSVGLKNIFAMLADEERKHYEAVKKLRDSVPVESWKTTVLGDAKEVFEKMRESTEKFDFDISEVELYSKARDIEEASEKFYLAKAEEVDQEVQKKLFSKLAGQEHKHVVLMENIVDFVSRPESWLENAEFHHLEEY